MRDTNRVCAFVASVFFALFAGKKIKKSFIKLPAVINRVSKADQANFLRAKCKLIKVSAFTFEMYCRL